MKLSKFCLIWILQRIKKFKIKLKNDFGIPLQNVSTTKNRLISIWIFRFFRIFGAVNPRQPNQFFKLLIVFLRFDGIWPPDTKSKLINTLYLIYSRWHRGFWLHLYVITQALYFKDVNEISVKYTAKEWSEHRNFSKINF